MSLDRWAASCPPYPSKPSLGAGITTEIVPLVTPSIAEARGVVGEDCLSEASSAAAARFEKHRATRSRKAKGVTSGSPSLGYLSWRDKKGTVPAGHPRHQKIARKRTKQIARLCAGNPDSTSLHPGYKK